jgi:hypothetical protein
LTLQDILRLPTNYDIIVGDFGRDATIEFVRQVALKEKQFIKGILEDNKLEFFDEYRRIMFAMLGDVRFYKELAIEESLLSKSYLTEDILIGVGGITRMSQDFVDRVSFAVIQEVQAAIYRGHKNLRIMIPCNTLSDLAKHIGQIFCSEIELKRISEKYNYKICELSKIMNPNLTVHTVPESVMRYFETKKNGNEKKHLLVLGTRGTNEIYRDLTNLYDVAILPIDEQEQNLIDKAIVASIDGNQSKVNYYRQLLEKDVIRSRKSSVNELVVLEACTDFRLGLGYSSLDIFAEAMIADCYSSILKSDWGVKWKLCMQ